MSRELHMMRWVIWILAAVFYSYEFFIRVSPSVMVQNLMTDLHIDAAAVGTLSAFYLYAYAPLQVPIGILMDFIGARRSLVFATALCGAGSILFGIAPVYWLAAVGRLLQGAGSAFAFIGLVYISSFWFPGHIIATLVGLGTALGFLGGFLADETLALSVELIGWRTTSIIIGTVGVLLAVLMFVAMKREPPAMQAHHEETRADTHELLDGLKWIASNWQTWFNGLVSLLSYAATSAFAGLWSITFFQTAAGMTKVQAGFVTSALFLGWVPGAPIIGRISDSLDRRKAVIVICCLLAAGCLTIPILFPHLPSWLIFCLLLFTGFFGAAQLLTFPYAIEINKNHAAGTATALTNFMVMAGGAFLQPFVGFLIDLNGGNAKNGLQMTMLLFPLCFVAAALLALLYHGRPRRQATPS